MLKSFEEFKDNIVGLIKVRAKNYVNTDCDINTLIDVVYEEITQEVHFEWIFQKYTITEDTIEINLPNDNGIYDIPEPVLATERYDEVYDVVNYVGLDMIENLIRIDLGKFRFIDESIHQQFIGETWIFVRPKMVDIDKLELRYLNALYRAMIEGIMYHIEVSIPSQVDVQFSNLTYQRYYNARKELTNKFPQIKYYEKYKPLKGRLIHEHTT